MKEEKNLSVKKLKKNLDNKDENVRFQATQQLKKKLDDPDSKERMSALEALSEGFNIKYPNVIINSIDAVINSLDNEDVRTESEKILLKDLENKNLNSKNKNKINIFLLNHENINFDIKKKSIVSIANDLMTKKLDDFPENFFEEILLFLENEKNEELKNLLLENVSNVLENKEIKEFLLSALNNKNENIRKEIENIMINYLYNENNLFVKEQSINILYKALNNENEDVKNIKEKKFESKISIKMKKIFTEIYSKAIFNNNSNSQKYSVDYLINAILNSEKEIKMIIYSSLKQILFNGHQKHRFIVLSALSKLNIEDIDIQNDIIDIFNLAINTDCKNAFSILKEEDFKKNLKILLENFNDIQKIIFLFKILKIKINQNEKDDDILNFMNENVNNLEDRIKNSNIELDENSKNNLEKIRKFINNNENNNIII